MKKRVFIYIRVSTREQAEEGYSIGEQEARLIKYCEAMDWEVIKVYIDPGFTGANIDRPALKEMIDEIHRGNADIVLVDKLDRLSRSQFDTLYLIQKVFNPNDCAFVSRAEAFDTSTPFGRAMVGILAVFAELERERIKERMQDGKEGRAKEGKYRGGGNVPTGYEYDPESGYLKIVPYDAMQVREMFDLFNARTPVYTIVTMFNNKGYRTKDGEWNETRVRGMIKNKTYIGMLKHKGEWYDGGHDPIIDLDTWNKAQQIIKERDKANANKKVGRRYTSPLGGLLWCKHCGSRYHYRTNGANKTDGKSRAYYICYSREGSQKNMIRDINCKNKTYRDHVLEDIVYAEVRKLKDNPEYIPQIHKSIDDTKKRKQIENRIDVIKKKISNLMELYSVGGIDINDIKDQIAPLNNERTSLQYTLDEMIENTSKKRSVDEIKTLVTVFENALAEKDTKLVNDMLNELIEKIVIDDSELHIHWNF